MRHRIWRSSVFNLSSKYPSPSNFYLDETKSKKTYATASGSSNGLDAINLTNFEHSYAQISNVTVLCKDGGKCTSKWRSYQKYEMLPKDYKKLQDQDRTNKLIKVLSNTRQRTLRSSSKNLKTGMKSMVNCGSLEKEALSDDLPTKLHVHSKTTSKSLKLVISKSKKCVRAAS